MDPKDEVKSKVDIVEVISSYVPLKKAGRNFAGLCPFHSEKTPSFMVSAERQVFKCFGCGEGGDVFTFLQKIEGWEFRDTLEELARRVGVKLTKFAGSAKSRERERLIDANSLASKFYSHVLNNHPLGARAREYLKKRKIAEAIWQKFGLGFSPAGWENTFNFLTKKGFSSAEIAQAGLIVSSQKTTGHDFYDRFRNRIMFPLKDSRGVVLGFAGRVIASSQSQSEQLEAKYINSPETPIFNKGSLLFGLDVARDAIRKKSEAVLVEGEFDVLSAFGAGVENVVASKGTALTQQQAVILSRICENVVLSFDKDIAGDAASRRGIEILDTAGLSLKVLILGKYKDPDEFVLADQQGFKKAILGAVNVYDYLIDSAINRFNPKTADGKKKIGREVIPSIAAIGDDLVRAHYIDKLAKVLELDVNFISRAIEKNAAGVLPGEDLAFIGEDQKESTGLEKYFLSLFLFQDEVSYQVLRFLSPSDFEDIVASSFWQTLRDIIGASKTIVLKKVINKIPKRFSEFVDTLYLVNISPVFSDRELWVSELVKIAGRIKRKMIKKKLFKISQDIKLAEKESDAKKIAILTKRFDNLSKNLKEVQIGIK